MIFKTTLKDINNMAVAIDKISTMTLPNYTGLGVAIDGLTAKQAALVLSTRNLSQAELEEVIIQNDLLTKYGAEELIKSGLLASNSFLLDSEKAVNAENLKQSIIQAALNEEQAKEFIQKNLIVAANGEESASTVILNKALMDEAVKRGILSEEKAIEILSTYGVVTADVAETASKKGLRKAISGLIKQKVVLSALDAAAIVGVAALVFTIYKCNKAVKEARDKAQELGSTFRSTKSDIDDYKSKIEELYNTINDSGSSIEDVTNARKILMSVQDELIEKYGTEEEAIKNINDAISGQAEALDGLTKKQWQEAKNKFNKGGFWNNAANFFQGTNNIERMLDEYGEHNIAFPWVEYAGDMIGITDEMVAKLENIGIDIKVKTDNLQSLRDFDSLTESIVGKKGISLYIEGNAEEIYNKILSLQNLTNGDDSFGKFYKNIERHANSYKELTDKYKDFYNQYILYEKILTEGSDYAAKLKDITDAYEEYREAFISGDEGKIKETTEKYAETLTESTAQAIANGDSDIATYFENMYPTLKSTVEGWKFNIAFDANTDNVQNAVQSVLDELTDENGRRLTTEEILGLDEANKQYQDLISIAHSYNMSIEEMIELLKERNLVAAMDYQGLVGLFGQENVDKLLPEDLEIAYQIKNVGNMTFDELQSAIEKTKEAVNEPLILSTQLNNSADSLDKFQSSVKSAADAYATLLSGNYSSSELLDSIQAINKAASDMGKSINWEAIAASDNPLKAIQDEIESVSKSYAESVLSGTGIEDSPFGQMLANIVQEAYKSEAALNSLNKQIDSLQSAYNDLTDIVATYNKTGYITFDQLQTLLAMEPQYLSCLIDENGQLQLNQEAMQALANQRLNDARAQIIEQTITELGELQFKKEKSAIEGATLALEDNDETITSYEERLLDFIPIAELTTEEFIKLSNAINGAVSNDVSDEDIDEVFQNAEKKLKLLKDMWNGNLKNMLGGSSSEKDTTKEFDWIEQAIENVKKEVKALDDVVNSAYSTFSQKNDALAKEIKKVSEEIELQQKAYEEYMRKADSIGLSDDYKNLIRDGAINIENITDENLQKKISDYQQWYEKAIDVSEAISDLNEQMKDLHVKGYELQAERLEDLLDSNSITEKQYLAEMKNLYKEYYEDQVEYAQKAHEAKLKLLEKEKSYLNSVAGAASSILDKEIDTIRENAELQEEALNKQIDSYNVQIDLLNKKKKPLQDELDALEDKVRNEELALNLQKAQYDLAKAENQRSKLVNYMPDTIVI